MSRKPVMDVLYGVVVENEYGGQSLDSFKSEDSAQSRADEIIDHIKANNREGFSVYLSELEYDKANSRITSSAWTGENATLIYKSEVSEQ